MSHFEKVSFEEFATSCKKLKITDDENIIQKIYDNIKLPQRGTKGSAGYDFYSPFNIHIPGTQIVMNPIITTTTSPVKLVKEYTVIPTGIRFVSDRDDVVLFLVPRSGLGFKYMVGLANTTGVIDSDYCWSDNQGHILAKIGSELPVDIPEGTAIVQGIILNYLTVDNEDTSNMSVRNGGFGSTTKGV